MKILVNSEREKELFELLKENISAAWGTLEKFLSEHEDFEGFDESNKGEFIENAFNNCSIHVEPKEFPIDIVVDRLHGKCCICGVELQGTCDEDEERVSYDDYLDYEQRYKENVLKCEKCSND